MTTSHIFTSPQGDVLIVGTPLGAARLVSREHAGGYHIAPDSVPHFDIVNRVHLAAIGVAAEMGLSFEIIELANLAGFDQQRAPITRLDMAAKIRALLIPFDLPFALCPQLFLSDLELSMIVCHSYALPRNKAFADIARRLMTAPSASLSRRSRNSQTGGGV